MTYEQIIKLWKQGYSKKYLFEEEYNSLKKNSSLKGIKASELKKMAISNITSTLLTEYYKDKKDKVFKKK